MTKRVYIAGPMTGKPAYNFPAFDAAAEKWRAAGWEVSNPADITRAVWKEANGTDFNPEVDKCDYGDPLLRKMMAADIAAVVDCDAIALLPGWGQSRGATVELLMALNHDKPAYEADTMAEFPVAASINFRNTQESALEEAQRLVHGDRQAAYGHPIDDYTRTGRMWGAILGIPDIDPRICTLMMAAVKVSREVNAPKRDNRVDLAGYAECAQLIAERQAETKRAS